jgi:cytochrome c biogenesis protein CcdA
MLYLVAFTGGILTIVSPCILPVLPFVFARAGQPFRRSGLPMLIGMALTFAVVGSLAAVAGEWIVQANQTGRTVALAAFALFGVTLLVPSLADRLARPFVRFGGAVQRQGESRASTGGSILLGMAAGLLWTPCAGPILGLILGAVAIEGTNASSALMLVAFASGAACALAVALLVGGRALRWMKQSLGAEVWIRRVLGAAVLAGVISIAFGWDTSILARVSLTTVGTATSLEQRLVDRVRPSGEAPAMAMTPAMMMMQGAAAPAETTSAMPPLDGAVQWFNSPALTREGLRGKVVLIDFWTYSCINCLRAIPYVDAWARKYKDSGLVVIGVHTPEFAF